MTQKNYQIRDPIYGFIPFNEWEKAVIDHPAFQRLRRIKQLALTEMVYPGATHTRFEHSLGVMHLASLMFDAITKNSDNIELLNEEGYKVSEKSLQRDRQIIRFAALLHDIGHAPFAHASDDIFPIKEKTEKLYSHEDYSERIIDDGLKDVIENKDLNNFDIKAKHVSSLIKGVTEPEGARSFWKELISSQLDADRGDYLLRDSHHIGVKYGIYDYPLLLNTVTLGHDNDELVIGIEESGMHVAEAIVLARYQIFTQVYFHKTRKAYDYHLKNGIKNILLKGKYPTPEFVDKYIEYNDFSIWEKMKNKNDENYKSIINREHIREVFCSDEFLKRETLKKVLKFAEYKLKNNGIRIANIDKSEQTWYKFGSKEENLEIKIVNSNKNYVKPLSKKSKIIENLKSMNMGRIYTYHSEKEKALKIIKKSTNKIDKIQEENENGP